MTTLNAIKAHANRSFDSMDVSSMLSQDSAQPIEDTIEFGEAEVKERFATGRRKRVVAIVSADVETSETYHHSTRDLDLLKSPCQKPNGSQKSAAPYEEAFEAAPC